MPSGGVLDEPARQAGIQKPICMTPHPTVPHPTVPIVAMRMVLVSLV